MSKGKSKFRSKIRDKTRPDRKTRDDDRLESKPGRKATAKHKVHSGITALCPECDANVRFKAPPRYGQRVTCSRCGSRLEVVETAPVELDWARKVRQTQPKDRAAYDDVDEAADEFEFDTLPSEHERRHSTWM